MLRIGDEFVVTLINYNIESLNNNHICKVLNLSNGGFVIGYVN